MDNFHLTCEMSGSISSSLSNGGISSQHLLPPALNAPSHHLGPLVLQMRFGDNTKTLDGWSRLNSSTPWLV